MFIFLFSHPPNIFLGDIKSLPVFFLSSAFSNLGDSYWNLGEDASPKSYPRK